MDGNHAMGCTLLGLAFTTLLVRIVWNSSRSAAGARRAARLDWKAWLAVASVIMIAGGCWLLSLPVDPQVAARNAEEGFQFH